MIEEAANVVSVQGKYVEIQMQRQSACSHCELERGCGTGAIGRMLGHRNKPLFIENTLNMKPGDRILLGMPDRSFLKASLLIYGLPLGLLVISTVLAQIVSNGSEVLVPIAAVAGLLGGLFISAKLTRKRFARQFNPRVLQINNELKDQF